MRDGRRVKKSQSKTKNKRNMTRKLEMLRFHYKRIKLIHTNSITILKIPFPKVKASSLNSYSKPTKIYSLSN